VAAGSALFREELDALTGRLDLRLVHILKEPPDGWLGERGQFTRELLEMHLPRDRDGLHYFICGPTAMTQRIEKWLKSLHVAPALVRSEIFEWV
jgi:NAD(P)H-flavin reductase